MYDIFLKEDFSEGVGYKPPEFDLIKETYLENVDTVITYYNNHISQVLNSNILVRLLNTYYISTETDLDLFIESAINKANDATRLYGFTNSYNSGKFHNNLFFNEGCEEAIISSNEINIYNLLQVDWRNIESIKIIDHQVSNLSLRLLDGLKNDSSYGLAVIEINIPLLLYQYRCFLIDQQHNESASSPEQFVKMYVLPNMLRSHIDIIMFNRFRNIYLGLPMDISYKTYPFYLKDYSFKLDKIFIKLINYLRNRPLEYTNVLKLIPTISNVNMLTTLRLPDLTLTRQYWWLSIISRLKHIVFLIQIGGDRNKRFNLTDINKLKIELKQLLRSNILEAKLPNSLIGSIKEDIDFIIKC